MSSTTDPMKNYNLAKPFRDAAEKYPFRLALSVDGKDLTYSSLLNEVARYVKWLQSSGVSPKRVGILASRSEEAYVGILSCAWIGAAYVPLDINLPEHALVGILDRSGLDALIADTAGSKRLDDSVLACCPEQILARPRELSTSSHRRVTDFADLPSVQNPSEPAFVERCTVGYMMYTSGSTGVPKAVVVPVGGVDHLLWTLSLDYPVTEEDRTAGTSPITFDVSVYDMFSTWSAGASLHVIPAQESIAPSKFIRENQITIWSSAPSIAAQMARMGLLKPNAFPSLRRSFFAGEAFPSSVAEAWQVAAPNSKVSNMYGPTEATVLCIGQDYSSDSLLTGDCVAIGWSYRGMKAAIASPELQFVADGTRGELLLAGPQLALGYLDDEEKTRRAFVHIGQERWYLTGDLACKEANGLIHYLGRIDHQIKVLGGARVELGEIECHLRAVTGCESVVAVAWPQQGGVALGIVAFFGGYDGNVTKIRRALKERVPAYMVPSHIHFLPELPLNSNGKIDRNQLNAFLDA